MASVWLRVRSDTDSRHAEAWTEAGRGQKHTDARPAVGVHPETFAALAVIRAGSVDARLLASPIELLALIHIWEATGKQIISSAVRQMDAKQQEPRTGRPISGCKCHFESRSVLWWCLSSSLPVLFWCVSSLVFLHDFLLSFPAVVNDVMCFTCVSLALPSLQNKSTCLPLSCCHMIIPSEILTATLSPVFAFVFCVLIFARWLWPLVGTQVRIRVTSCVPTVRPNKLFYTLHTFYKSALNKPACDLDSKCLFLIVSKILHANMKMVPIRARSFAVSSSLWPVLKTTSNQFDQVNVSDFEKSRPGVPNLKLFIVRFVLWVHRQPVCHCVCRNVNSKLSRVNCL